jgi:hypothetical protein
VKKRYIYASLLSVLLFIILYVVLDFNVIISIILALVTYVGGIFFFKEKDVRKYDPNLIMHYCYLISKIDNYTNLIEDDKVDKDIKDISVKSEKIVNMLEHKPDKVTQVYDGFDYYLPFTIKILEQYVLLQSTEGHNNDDEKKFIKEINTTLDYIEKEIDKLLNNMNYTKMLDVNASIEVFKKQANSLEKKMNKGKEEKEDA